jgi:Flp pilus assembly protein TadB
MGILLGAIICIIWSAITAARLQKFANREKVRSHRPLIQHQHSVGKKLNRLFGNFALKTASGYEANAGSAFHYASFSSLEERARFLVFQAFIICAGVGIAAWAYATLDRTSAVIGVVVAGGGALLIPLIALRKDQKRRRDDLDRDFVNFCELIWFEMQSGMELEPALESSVSLMNVNGRTGLLSAELEQVRKVAARGYTWGEALEGLSEQLNDETIQRCCRSLRAALKSTDDRRRILEQIVDDAREVIARRIDYQLAGLPTKTFLLTLCLVVACFSMALAPVAVQVKESVMERLVKNR